MKVKSQFQLQEEIREKLNLALSTCGNCGDVFIIDLNLCSRDEIKCPICGFEEEYCHFPDLFLDEPDESLQIKIDKEKILHTILALIKPLKRNDLLYIAKNIEDFAEKLRKYKLIPLDYNPLILNPDEYKIGKSFRIEALKDFSDVKKGDLGGIIEKEENLSHEGNCWVYDGAAVINDAKVGENAIVANLALVSGHATVYGNAIIKGNSSVEGHAIVFGNAEIGESAIVTDRVIIQGNAKVFGNGQISGSVKLSNGQISDGVKVSGDFIIDENIVLDGMKKISKLEDIEKYK